MKKVVFLLSAISLISMATVHASDSSPTTQVEFKQDFKKVTFDLPEVKVDLLQEIGPMVSFPVTKIEPAPMNVVNNQVELRYLRWWDKEISFIKNYKADFPIRRGHVQPIVKLPQLE